MLMLAYEGEERVIGLLTLANLLNAISGYFKFSCILFCHSLSNQMMKFRLSKFSHYDVHCIYKCKLCAKQYKIEWGGGGQKSAKSCLITQFRDGPNTHSDEYTPNASFFNNIKGNPISINHVDIWEWLAKSNNHFFT